VSEGVVVVVVVGGGGGGGGGGKVGVDSLGWMKEWVKWRRRIYRSNSRRSSSISPRSNSLLPYEILFFPLPSSLHLSSGGICWEELQEWFSREMSKAINGDRFQEMLSRPASPLPLNERALLTLMAQLREVRLAVVVIVVVVVVVVVVMVIVVVIGVVVVVGGGGKMTIL